MKPTRESQPDPRDYLAADELKELSRRRPLRIVLTSILTWAWILGAFWLWAWSGHPVVLAAAFVVIATRQHALNNLVHEAAHYNISRNKWWNAFLSDLLYATPHLISTKGYRGKHLAHHRYLGSIEHDLELKFRYLIRGWGFLRRTFLVMTGLALLEAFQSYRPALTQRSSIDVRYLVLVIVTNGALFGHCYWLGIPYAYLYLWLLPLFTLTLYLAALRVIAEHQPEEYALRTEENWDTDVEPPLTRDILAGPVERFVFGPINFCYHQLHHLYPSVPYTSLPRLFKILRERGFYDDFPECYAPSYLEVLRRQIFPKPS